MNLTLSMYISESGMRAQAARLKIVAQNIANQESTALTPNKDPYRRKTIYFNSIMNNNLGTEVVDYKVSEDNSAFNMKFNPNHPAADKDGYVKYPNVNNVIEVADSQEASLYYKANLGVISTARNMIMKALDLLSNK